MPDRVVAGRAVDRVYRVVGRRDLVAFLRDAVERSGASVLYMSDPGEAPVYIAARLSSDERLGMLVYPFRVTRRSIRNRPSDEVRGQLRYGGEASWAHTHTIARDVAGVDATLILGVDLEDQVFLGLDAQLWDPLPMGISFYAKHADVAQARANGWHVWEKENRAGTRRTVSRSPSHFETVVAFSPERLIDYARLERGAAALRLEPGLRFAAASLVGRTDPSADPAFRHNLEAEFSLSSREILDIIKGRNRLSVAVRGGVAEHHLEQQLLRSADIARVARLDSDAMHDFDVHMREGRAIRVECKNASPHVNKDGSFRVEVQKTRASKNDPSSRFYRADSFDVVAACLFSATGRWEFRYARTSDMSPHRDYPGRLAAIQRVDSTWAMSLAGVA